MAAKKGFEEIDHTADRAFRVTGGDMASLLENAARAMRALDGQIAEFEIYVGARAARAKTAS